MFVFDLNDVSMPWIQLGGKRQSASVVRIISPAAILIPSVKALFLPVPEHVAVLIANIGYCRCNSEIIEGDWSVE
jgi:hypothetical protein